MKKKITVISVAMLLVVASAFSAFAADGSSSSFDSGKALLIALGVGLLIAVIAILVMYSQLKSVHFQSGAAEYIKKDSMQVTGSYEHFLYSTVTKIKIPKDNK